MSAQDRSWMYKRAINGAPNPDFSNGVDSFIEFAKSHPSFMDRDLIKCPCQKLCKNAKFKEESVVRFHLFKYGFIKDYTCWHLHGEPYVMQHMRFEPSPQCNVGPSLSQQLPNHDEHASHDPTHNMGLDEQDRLRDMLADVFPNMANDSVGDIEAPNEDAQKYYDVLKSLDVPVYKGSNMSKLAAMARLINAKVEGNMTQNAFNINTSILKEILPEDNVLDKDYRETKKTLKPLGLGIKYIDACRNDCMLFYKNGDENLTRCKICNLERYKPKRKRGSKGVVDTEKGGLTAHKVLRYLPLKARLQRLYTLPEIATAMTWHKDCSRKEGMMSHPSDGEAWKHFDNLHPDFASDPRNVRLCLSADGFNPLRGTRKTYSMWPVIVTPLNLPPWLCMKDEFMFLSLLIPGDKSPGRNIDVYLQPLIDELNDLWKDGCNTYDSSKKQNFQMKAALMWTVSDFPAYGMLSGWSTHEKLACPVCMGQTKGFRLTKGGKTCFFDCHRQFLPEGHAFRDDKHHFIKGKEVLCEPPCLFNGEEVVSKVNRLPHNRFGKEYVNDRPPRFGVDHNWTKKSIFWELPYWSDLLVRHMLDVMHIEKNIFDNIFHTIMDVKGKTKDNPKARLDIAMLCSRKSLELKKVRGKDVKPPAPYTLTKEKKKALLEWVLKLKLPDGYSSNLSTCVDMNNCKMSGMKSHDCHVFLARLLPVALRELLPSSIWGPITEISEFFRCLCASSLSVEHMRTLESSIVVTLCKLEKIFPPSLFDSMEHLPVHLAYEARVGGPVQYRWMYPFERFLNGLKRKVKNNSAIEASVTEAVLIEEVATFCSRYLSSEVRSRLNKEIRNDDGGGARDDSIDKLSVFTPQGRFLGKKPIRNRPLSLDEILAAELYVIMNCPELEPYIEKYEEELHQRYPNLSDIDFSNKTDAEIKEWLISYAKRHPEDKELHKCKYLLMGPNGFANVYKGYFVNGYAFRTSEFDDYRVTSHSGVSLGGSEAYFGVLLEVLELSYPGHDNNVVLFNCDWRNSIRGVRKHAKYDLLDVDIKSKHYGKDVFILATQAEQVYFSPYPRVTRSNTSRSDWHAVWKTKARKNIDIHYIDAPTNPTPSSLDSCLQEDVMPVPPNIEVDGTQDDVEMLPREGEDEEIDPNDLPTQQRNRDTLFANEGNIESESESESEHSKNLTLNLNQKNNFNKFETFIMVI